MSVLTARVISEFKKLRPWQTEALGKWLERRRGVVSAATGGGKTLFALHCFSHIRYESEPLRLAIVVPTLALLDQWVVSLESDLGLDSASIATYSGEGRAPIPKLANVFVINTAREIIENVTRDGNWMLIVDECHRAGSEENARALRGTYTAVLGISATPHRQYDEGFATYVEPILGPVIYEYDYVDARRDGVIAPFDLINIKFPLTTKEQSAYNRLTRAIAAFSAHGVGYSPDEMTLEGLLRKRARVSISSKMRVPTAIAALRPHQGKAIVFHERIQAAEEIAAILDKGDRRATTYHSKVYGPIRRERLRLFREGAFDTLVTCRSLDEGLNVPDASVAMLAASTSSKRQRIQRLGRVLRTSDPEKRALVLTLYATEVERKQLELEEKHLIDVATVEWLTVAIHNGS